MISSYHKSNYIIQPKIIGKNYLEDKIDTKLNSQNRGWKDNDYIKTTMSGDNKLTNWKTIEVFSNLILYHDRNFRELIF